MIRRFLSALWSGVDALRKLLHLLLLLFIFAVFISALSGNAPTVIPSRAALVIEPQGSLVEEVAGDPFDRAINEALGDGQPQALVQDIVDGLAYARDDDRIQVVYLELTGLVGGGLSKLQRVADAIEDFRSSGKKVVANADFMTQQAYYLAAHANEVYMHPDGFLFLEGYDAYRTYYKDAIDLLRIDWNVFRVGTHKTAFESYTRMNMSDEDRESLSDLLGRMWTLYQQGVVSARGLEPDAVQAFVQQLIDNARAADGDLAQAAVQAGLVDELLSRSEIRDRMVEYVGESDDSPGNFNSVGLQPYLAQMRLTSGDSAMDDNVAVIVASGEIEFGSQPPGTIGGDSTAALIRRARNDDSVRAIVLRIDSPGGSTFASEVIADEIRATQAAGIPVVASMSSVAASGGYYIAMDADRIVASPATITGSIGILGMFPTFQRSLAAIGIAVDGVATTSWAGAIRPDREMSPQARELFQLAIEDGYRDFVQDVATGRGLEYDDVDRVAQGQVWTAPEAVEYGLVDELGELDDAIETAAGLAGLDEYGVTLVQQEMSETQKFILSLIDTGSRIGIDASAWLHKPSALDRMAAGLLEQARSLLRFNDPSGLYSHCFCDIE